MHQLHSVPVFDLPARDALHVVDARFPLELPPLLEVLQLSLVLLEEDLHLRQLRILLLNELLQEEVLQLVPHVLDLL